MQIHQRFEPARTAHGTDVKEKLVFQDFTKAINTDLVDSAAENVGDRKPTDIGTIKVGEKRSNELVVYQ